MPLKNERTGAIVRPDPQASSLMLGRRQGEGILVAFDGIEVVLLLEDLRANRCTVRVVAHPCVEISRLRGEIDG